VSTFFGTPAFVGVPFLAALFVFDSFWPFPFGLSVSACEGNGVSSTGEFFSYCPGFVVSPFFASLSVSEFFSYFPGFVVPSVSTFFGTPAFVGVPFLAALFVFDSFWPFPFGLSVASVSPFSFFAFFQTIHFSLSWAELFTNLSFFPSANVAQNSFSSVSRSSHLSPALATSLVLLE